MEDLRTLVNLISKQKLSQIDIITSDKDLSSHSKKLYNGVLSGQYTTDYEAALDIYNKAEDADSYKKLKYRLKQKLINTLFFIDIQGYSKSAYSKAIIRNYKNVSAVMILLDNAPQRAAMHLAEITLKAAVKYDMSDIIIILLPRLIRHYGIFEYNKKKYLRYKDLLKKHHQILAAELQAEILYIESGQMTIHSKHHQSSQASLEIEKELDQMKVDFPDVNSYKYQLTKYSAEYMINLLHKKYELLDKICIDAIQYFSKRKGFSDFAKFDFNMKHAVVHIYYKRYDKALRCLDICNSLNKVIGNYNWFLVHSYQVLVYFNQRNYDQAYFIATNVINNKKFKSSYELFRQQWIVKEAYIQFLVRILKVDLTKFPDNHLKPFRLSRFLNDVDLMIKDKKGMNVPVIIIEILTLILDEKWDVIENRPTRIRKKLNKYHNRLIAIPFEMTEQEIQVEIIPYEDLWEMTLGLLDKADMPNE